MTRLRAGSATTGTWWACSSRIWRAGTPGRLTSAWCRSRYGRNRCGRSRTESPAPTRQTTRRRGRRQARESPAPTRRTARLRGRGRARERTRDARTPGRSLGRSSPTLPLEPSSESAPSSVPTCARSSTPRSPSTSTRTQSSCAFVPRCRPGTSPAPRPSAWNGSCGPSWTRGMPCGGAERGGRRRRRRSEQRMRPSARK